MNIEFEIKLYTNKVNTNFQVKEVPKENAPYDCLSLITLDCVTRINKKHYPQDLLDECKYKIRKNKKDNFIKDDLELDNDSESYNKFEGESGGDYFVLIIS